MRVGPITPTVRIVAPSTGGGSDQAEGAQVRRRVLGADDHRQPRALDVLVQQVNHALFFFHHFQQRAERGHRHRFLRRAIEQRGRALHVEGVMLRQFLERHACQAERTRQQLIVERALLEQALEDGLADVEQRQPGELRVEIVRRLHEIVGTDVFAGVDDLLRHLVALRDDHDRARAGLRARRTRSAAARRRRCRPWQSPHAAPRATRHARRWPAGRPSGASGRRVDGAGSRPLPAAAPACGDSSSRSTNTR